MIEEVVSTSTPRGLRPGTRGLCAVAATAGMSEARIDRVEALSGYRHYFESGGALDRRNQTCWMHLTMHDSGEEVSVLSRIGPLAGDSGSRTNRIAHHIVVPKAERPAAGPAECLGLTAVFESSWSGEPRTLRRDLRLTAPQPRSARVCDEWKRAAGDPGWAGVALDAVLRDDSRPLFIVVPDGIDAMKLVQEVCSLLPLHLRWRATFSTWYGGDLGPSVDCRLRFLPDTSAAHALVDGIFGADALVLSRVRDTAPLASAAAIESARSGTTFGASPSVRPDPTPPTIGPTRSIASDAAAAESPSHARPEHRPSPPDPNGGWTAEPHAVLQLPTPAPRDPFVGRGANGASSRALWVGLGIGALVGVVVAVAGLIVIGTSSGLRSGEIRSTSMTPAANEAPTRRDTFEKSPPLSEAAGMYIDALRARLWQPNGTRTWEPERTRDHAGTPPEPASSARTLQQLTTDLEGLRTSLSTAMDEIHRLQQRVHTAAPALPPGAVVSEFSLPVQDPKPIEGKAQDERGIRVDLAPKFVSGVVRIEWWEPTRMEAQLQIESSRCRIARSPEYLEQKKFDGELSMDQSSGELYWKYLLPVKRVYTLRLIGVNGRAVKLTINPGEPAKDARPLGNP